MKFILVSIVLCAAIYVGSARKVLTSSSRHLAHRETNLLKRLVKRQALNDQYCDRRQCAVPHCGKDYVATTLPNECCERCIPWEYANSLGIPYSQGSQPPQDPRNQQYNNDPYNQQPQQPQQPQQYPQNRVDVYIYGPDEGARVSAGQSIYFDCEVNAPYNQNAQPRWSRSGNQPLPYKVQSTTLPGNRQIARLTIPDAAQSDGGRYECTAGTGNPSDQASIDVQVTEGGYYPQPQPQPQPQYPNYDPYNQYPYNQYPYNQPGYNPQQPEPQPQPQPNPDDQGDNEDDGEDDGQDGNEDGGQEPAAEPTTQAPTPSQDDAEGGEDEGEYPEEYSDVEK